MRKEENYKPNYSNRFDWDNTEMLKNKQQLREHEKEKNLLMERMIGLKLRIDELMVKS